MARFVDSATLILLVAVVLFCSDAAYTSAICRELQLDSNMFERSIYQSLYNGFKLNLGLMLDFSLYGVIGCISGLLVRKYYTQGAKADGKPSGLAFLNSGFSVKISSFFNSSGTINSVAQKSRSIGFIIEYARVVLFFSLFLSIVIYNEFRGESQGDRVRAAIVDGSASLIRIGEAPGLFFHLYCGGSMCAAIDLEKK